MNGLTMKKMAAAIVAVIAFLVSALFVNAEMQSKYDGTYGGAADTSAAVTFGAVPGRIMLKSLNATTDLEGGQVKLYCRPTTLAKFAPTSAPTNGAVVVAISNTGIVVTNGDSVVYQHANGTCDYTTISDATTSNVTLAAGITVAGASGDYLYEVTQQGFILVGLDGTAAGTSDVLNISGDLFATPGDSPLYMVLDGTSNTVLQATVEKP